MPYPTKKTDKVCEEILLRLSNGEPLAAICRSDDKFPHPSVWLDWTKQDEALGFAYARAREVGEDVIAEDALLLIDSEPSTYQTEHGIRIDPASVAHNKNRAEMRLKLLAKWNPKRWGDRIDVTSGGEKLQREAGETEKFSRLAALMAEKREQGLLPDLSGSDE